jgi:outer membrane protein insertion porin family
MKLLVLLFIFITSAFAISVSEVEVNCNGSLDCNNVETSYKSLKRKYTDLDHLKRTVKLYVLNKGIKHFSYSIFEEESKFKLLLNLKLKKQIGSIDFEGLGDIEIPTILPISEGSFYDGNNIKETVEIIKNVLFSKGYVSASVKVEEVIEDDEYDIVFKVRKGSPVTLREVNVFSESSFLYSFVNSALLQYKDKNFDLQRIKNKIEELRQLFISYGYYLVNMDINVKRISRKKMDINITVRNADLYVSSISGKGLAIDQKLLKDEIKAMVLSYKRSLTDDNVKTKIKSLFGAYGFDQVKIDIKTEKYLNINNDKVVLRQIKILQGEKRKLGNILFRRLSAIKERKLKRLFFERAPSVVKSGYYDPEYIKNFPELIKEYYIQRGYLGVFVENPKLNIVDESISVSYRIKEGIKSIVDKINLKGVPENLAKRVKSLLQTKERTPFNPTVFKNDIEVVENFFLDEGYYNFQINNKLSKNLVDYKSDSSTVDINFEIKLGSRLYVDKIIIVGNRKTRSKLILRELSLRESDIITKKNLQNSQTNLLGLGLFSSVVVKPVQNKNNYADLLVIVREKNFGLLEIAPGVRTDIGFKISSDLSYNNIDGLNKRISFKLQANQRFNLYSLDDERRQNSNSLVEYNVIANYSENYLFDYDVRFQTSLSQSRQRFFSFDADISRVNFTFSHSFTDWFSASTRYQFETIRQFDASQEIDEGTFQIGAITPSVTFDFRDNRINPTKGAWFNLSYESANPNFLSQSNDELIIDYFKVISRNRFYVPINNGVFAVSVAAGVQQNLARSKRENSDGDIETEGFIPNIKVFRLNGVDNVRGYEDNEINTLLTGEDISEVRVDDKAYMAVVKLEPRFFISDSSMFGVFYDAGRVYVDKYDFSELKSSVGFTFKYLTPVGSLDFDYGIKLLRKNDDGGKFDSPGRLHVSIGFF